MVVKAHFDALTHNSVHDDESDIASNIKLSFIALLLQVLNTICDTFVEDWNETLEDGKTER
jgi:hypothetical protein